MRIRELVIGSAGLLVLAGGALRVVEARPVEPTELRCGFAKGDKFVLHFHDTHTSTVEAPEAGDIKVSIELGLDAAVTVASVTDAGVATCKAKIARWRLKLDDGQRGGFTLDTRPDRGAPDRKLAGLNGKPFTLTVTTRGEVQKVDGLTRLLKYLAAAASDPKTAARLLESETSDDALRAKWQECWGPWPAEPAEASASWTQDCATTLALTGNPLKTTATATLAECGAERAIVRLTGTAVGTGGRATLWDGDDDDNGGGGRGRDRGGFDLGGMMRRVLRNTHVDYGSGTFTGERTLDRSTGLLAKSHSEWTSQVTMQIKMPGMGGFGGGGGGSEERAVPATVIQRRELRCERPGKK